MKLVLSKNLLIILWLASWCLAATGVWAQDETDHREQPRFINLQTDASGEPVALQVAIVSYAAEGEYRGGVSVDLISAVHIGDKHYYSELNRRFQEYDAVLFELVTADSDNLPGDGEAGFNLLSMFQGWMKNALGLSFQLEEIDYTPGNMVHADMTISEFRASMAARGESMFSMFMELWRAGMQQSLQRPPSGSDFDIFRAMFSSNRQQALKQVAAREFMDMEQFDAIMAAGDGSTLVTERNKKALQVLRDELAVGKQRIGIFYGAAHMPDMGQRLMQDFDLMPQRTVWVDAWDLQN